MVIRMSDILIGAGFLSQSALLVALMCTRVFLSLWKSSSIQSVFKQEVEVLSNVYHLH